MRTKVDTIQQLGDFLWKHQAVKAALRETEKSNRGRKTRGPKITSANPKKLIGAATSLDPRIGALINVTRRVCQCHNEGRAQLRKKIFGGKGEKTLDPKYLYKWAGIEHDYQTMVSLSYELVSSTPLIAGFAKAAKDIEGIHRFANPAFLDKSHIRLLKELGADPDELMDLYRFSYLPDQKLMDKKLQSVSERNLLAEGQKDVGKLAFFYAPERLLETGVLKLGGSDPVTIILVGAAIVGALASIASYTEELKQTAAQLRSANLLTFFVLWFIWNDLQNKLAQAQASLAQLQSQYNQEVARLEATRAESVTAPDSPGSVASEFNYVIANMSRSKMEVHLPNCSWLHLIRSEHKKTFQTLALARDAGLDNCYYCIGASKR